MGNRSAGRGIRPRRGKSERVRAAQMTVDSHSPWRPILDGDLAARVGERIARIGAALEAHHDRPATNDPTLADGDAGIALFFANAERDGGSASRRESVATSVLERASNEVDDRWRTPSLYSGVVGMAWALAHASNEFAGAADLSVDDLDEQLLELCRDIELDADLTYGLIGIGVYALERWPATFAADCIPLIIDRLVRASRPGLGLAHGMAGVIAFLSAASRLDRTWHRRIAPLVARHVEELMRHRLPPNEATCAFPAEIGAGPCRIAWCVGDTSIAAALLGAGVQFNREDWCSTARELALAASARPFAFSGVADAGLCHGAAGLGHLFNRLFQATGEEQFAATAREWFCHALNMPAHANNVAGFSAWNHSDDLGWHWHADRGFLTGAAGIGLALMAAIGSHEPTWDRVLLLSSRVPAAQGGR